MSHRIFLPCGSVAMVDAEDVHLLKGWSWYRLQKDGEPTYVVGQRVVDGRRQRVTLSRLVMGISDERLVDHICGDLLDNRKQSLRVCNHTQNMRNRRAARANRVGMKGVVEVKGRFQAAITVGGKRLHLGCYGTASEAARAYDQAAAKHFGEFSRLNFSSDRDWLFPHESSGVWPPLADTA